MRPSTLRHRFTTAAVLAAAALTVVACQPPAAKAPDEKPATADKTLPAQATSQRPSKPAAQGPAEGPAQPQKAPEPDAQAKADAKAQAKPDPFEKMLETPSEKLAEPGLIAPADRESGKSPDAFSELDRRTASEKSSGAGSTVKAAESVELSGQGNPPGRAPEKTVTSPAAEKPAAEKPPAEEETKPAAPKADDDSDTFSLKELEAHRKLIEEEMAKEAVRRAEAQKRRIAQLGAPLVDNVDKLIRLDKVFPVWTDREGKRVVMVGEVCQRQVPLEMFACTRHTKEHEAVVVFDAQAQIVHAGLLAVGAKPGKPVQFRPKYVPASGQEIEVTVVWKDAKGKQHSARAQDWVRHVETKKAMEYPWVFAGSGFTKDEYTGKTYYLADGGDFICVSNFGTAMLDLPVESSSVNADLAFEAFTERIPPEGTPVTLILTPKQGGKPALGKGKGKEAGPGGPSKPQDQKPGVEEPKS